MAFITLPLGDVNLKIEIEIEENGRFIAEEIDFPGAVACWSTRQEVVDKVQSLIVPVTVDKLAYSVVHVFGNAPTSKHFRKIIFLWVHRHDNLLK